MAKFYGRVGYGESKEDPPNSGVWVDTIVERKYYGDIQQNSRKLRETQEVSDDIVVENSISIVADAYANNHFFAMRYVEWMGALWIVQKVEVLSPRLILRLGGVYHGPTAPAPDPVEDQD